MKNEFGNIYCHPYFYVCLYISHSYSNYLHTKATFIIRSKKSAKAPTNFMMMMNMRVLSALRDIMLQIKEN